MIFDITMIEFLITTEVVCSNEKFDCGNIKKHKRQLIMVCMAFLMEVKSFGWGTNEDKQADHHLNQLPGLITTILVKKNGS